ncbi:MULTISPECIES: FtsX-like permease family protein [unclassified Luteococcus]|uniref:FtsX-like permease family protein n=1 Tax=unclassified Luteococcus TaxID=2639923 RepID=UPI00313D9392
MNASLPLRLARRDIAQHKGRTALILLLIALPLAVLSYLAVLGFSIVPTDEEAITQEMGQAVARISQVDEKVPLTTPTLSEGQRALPISRQQVSLNWPGSTVKPYVAAADWTEPGLRGRLRGAVDGDRAGVWVTTNAQWQYGIQPGQQVTLDGHEYRVNGVVGGMTSEDFLVFPGHRLASTKPTEILIIGAEPSPQQVAKWEGAGVSVSTRSSYAGNEGQTASIGALLLAAALIISTLTATITAAAFSIGVAKQRRSLALISATGAPAGVLQRIVAAQGLVLGVPAALAGVLVGVGLGAWQVSIGLRAPISSFAGLHIPWLLLVLLAVVGAGSATVAAWLPARKLARQDVLAAMRSEADSGRPPAFSRLGGALTVAGLVVAVVGGIWANDQAEPGTMRRGSVHVENFVISGMLGCALFFFGLLSNVGWLLTGVTRVSRGGSLPWRLAVRDGARHRGRGVSTVAAAMAATTLLTGAMVAFSTLGAEDLAHTQVPRQGWGSVTLIDADGKALSQKQADAVPAVVGKSLGQTPRAVSVATVPSSGSGSALSLGSTCPPGQTCTMTNPELYVATAEQVRQVLGEAASPEVLSVLTSGGVVSTDPQSVRDGKTSVLNIDGTTELSVELPGVVVDGPDGFAFLTPGTAAKHKLGKTQPALLLHVGAAPSVLQINQATADLDVLGIPGGLRMVPAPTDGYSSTNNYLLPGGIAVLLAIAALTTGLGLKDAREAHRTMAGVGASRATIRTMAGVQALVSTLIGVLLGILSGLLPMGLAMWVSQGRMPFSAPWGKLAVVLLVVPPLAMGLAWLLTRPPAPRAVRVD